jgi:predicted glycosyltransferase
MRLLFDINHPVQAHVFRPVVEALRSRGDECVLVARDKDVTLGLLDRFGMPAQVLAPPGRGPAGWVKELVVREARLLRLARRTRPRLIVGTTVSGARVARLAGARSVVVNDDDASAVPFFRWLAYPLASVVVTPDCLRHERHARQRTYPGCQQLFYLHPRRFAPDPAVRRELGLAAGERYGLVRLSARAAHHDRGVRGLGAETVLRLQERLSGRVRLLVTAEGALPASLEPLRLSLPPHRLHDALALASLYVGDSQSMTAEAAVLGVPAFRLNDFVGRISYLRELEDAGLARGFVPGQEDALVDAIESTVSRPDAERARVRERWLERVGDPLPWFLDLLDEMAGTRAA